jgi:5-methylcytosine-specific restriction endonuclease McrA
LVKDIQAKSRLKNHEKRLNQDRSYRQKNLELIRSKKALYRKTASSAAASRKHQRKRRQEPRWRLSDSVSRRIRMDIGEKKNRTAWWNLVGYTVDDLTAHLERQFMPGMSWENYGEVWNIDHRIPLAFFEFETPQCAGFKLAWNIKNLQPLLKSDNAAKGDRLPPPDQLEIYLRELQDDLGRPYQAGGFVGGQP